MQVPFHLKEMGSNTLGVYVCQWGFLGMLKNGGLLETLDNVQNEHYIKKSFVAGFIQLIFIYGALIWYWAYLGSMSTDYVMLPLKAARFVQVVWESFASYCRRLSINL